MITSTGNERIRVTRRLHRARYRRDTQLALFEGPEVVAALLASGTEVRWVCVRENDIAGRTLVEASGADLLLVSDTVLRSAAGTETPQGPIAVAPIPPQESLRSHDTVVLWRVTDPGNVGTLLRSAAAFGFDVATTEGTADIWSPKVLRAAAGAHFALGRLVRLGEHPLADIRAAGLAPTASLAAGGDLPNRVTNDPIALLIGSEAHGLPDDVVATVKARVTLPMSGAVESLNAAVAGSIAMYLLRGGSRLAPAGGEGRQR